MDTPYDIVSVAEAASTQDLAIEALHATGRPTLACAARQPAGRGRRGRSWLEPDRAMFSSYAFASSWPFERRPLITLCTGVALADAVASLTRVAASIKWPNDLVVGGRKVAGILVEATGDDVVIGCGANLWWQDPPSFAAGLLDADPGPEAALSLATAWVDVIRVMVEQGPDRWPRDRYVERSATLGASIRWDGGTGRAVDLDEAGHLVVDTGRGIETLVAGDVHLLGER